MSKGGHAGDALHYHLLGAVRYGHRHWYWHINHQHDEEQPKERCPICGDDMSNWYDPQFPDVCWKGECRRECSGDTR